MIDEDFEIRDGVTPVLESLKAKFQRSGPLLNRASIRLQGEMTKRAMQIKGMAAKGIERVPLLDEEGSAAIAVGTHFKPARFFEYGTGLFGPFHRRIYPKTKLALSWFSPLGKGRIALPKEPEAKRRRTRTAMFYGRITVKSTKGMKATPFLEPSLEIVRSEFENDILFEVKRGFEDAVSESGFTGVD